MKRYFRVLILNIIISVVLSTNLYCKDILSQRLSICIQNKSIEEIVQIIADNMHIPLEKIPNNIGIEENKVYSILGVNISLRTLFNVILWNREYILKYNNTTNTFYLMHISAIPKVSRVYYVLDNIENWKVTENIWNRWRDILMEKILSKDVFGERNIEKEYDDYDNRIVITAPMDIHKQFDRIIIKYNKLFLEGKGYLILPNPLDSEPCNNQNYNTTINLCNIIEKDYTYFLLLKKLASITGIKFITTDDYIIRLLNNRICGKFPNKYIKPEEAVEIILRYSIESQIRDKKHTSELQKHLSATTNNDLVHILGLHLPDYKDRSCVLTFNNIVTTMWDEYGKYLCIINIREYLDDIHSKTYINPEHIQDMLKEIIINITSIKAFENSEKYIDISDGIILVYGEREFIKTVLKIVDKVLNIPVITYPFYKKLLQQIGHNRNIENVLLCNVNSNISEYIKNKIYSSDVIGKDIFYFNDIFLCKYREAKKLATVLDKICDVCNGFVNSVQIDISNIDIKGKVYIYSKNIIQDTKLRERLWKIDLKKYLKRVLNMPIKEVYTDNTIIVIKNLDRR